jgi:propanol-preferring alcohol dehydrogenase
MEAMVLEAARRPLVRRTMPVPVPRPAQVLLEVQACAVCRTDLHVIDGELTKPKLPLVPGHEIVGIVRAVGAEVKGISPGMRMGVPWLGFSDGTCRFCRAGQENLCDSARFTGYDIDGGYAGWTVADHRFCFPIPDGYDDAHAAPLLCAGLIGYRSYRMTGDAQRLGFYGFGAAAHILVQVAKAQGKQVYAFTTPGDTRAQRFAVEMGADWAGGSDAAPPAELDAAILFAPVGALVPAALRVVRKGGTVVCAGIHMSDIPTFSYDLLWGERVVRSVANLTRQDGTEFLELARRIPLRTEVTRMPLAQANEALDDLRRGKLSGAAVLIPDHAARA